MIQIPDGYIAVDTGDELRELGMSEEALKELDEEIDELLKEGEDFEFTPEQQRLLSIIESPDTTWEEKEAARRAMDPDMYDENGNLVLDDSKFFERTEADLKKWASKQETQ